MCSRMQKFQNLFTVWIFIYCLARTCQTEGKTRNPGYFARKFCLTSLAESWQHCKLVVVRTLGFSPWSARSEDATGAFSQMSFLFLPSRSIILLSSFCFSDLAATKKKWKSGLLADVWLMQNSILNLRWHTTRYKGDQEKGGKAVVSQTEK